MVGGVIARDESSCRGALHCWDRQISCGWQAEIEDDLHCGPRRARWASRVRRGGKDGGELLTGTDVELEVGVTEVCLDGFGRYEQGLGDFWSAVSAGGELSDAELGGGERVPAAEHGSAGSGAGS